MSTPSLLAAPELPNAFLGDLIQVALVTRDYRKTLDGMVNLGIGPWAVFTVDSSNLSNFTYRGKPASCSFKMALARTGNMTYEVIQPTGGQSIYSDFIERHGDGVQHLAFNCKDDVYERRIQQLMERGYEIIQSGVYMNKVRFHYFGTEQHLGTVLEIIHFPEDFAFPAPEVLIPAPPAR